MASEASKSLTKGKLKSDFGAGLTSEVKQPRPPGGPLENEELSPASKALSLGSYFISGCMAINASQVLGAPLYLINQDWYNAWIAFTKQSFGLLTMTMTQWWAPTVMRVSGDKSVRGQLLQTTDGNLICNFPERLILIANHQIYTDWLYLWWIAYTAGMHGRIFIVLKESLKRIPILGWGMQFSQFIFLKRNWEKDKPHLAAHLQKFNNAKDSMWLMLFPEGTNLAPSTRDSSQQWARKNGIRDMRHQLLPRSTGLQFCLQELRKTVDYVYDCTIAYEGVPRGQYAQDIYTVGASYFGGHPPRSVNMYWRRFRVSTIPIDDPKAFDLWLRARWTEKDNLIEEYLRTGRFPADEGVEKAPDGKTRRGAGYITTEVKPNRWYEFLQVFAPIGLLALVLYVFYGALPKKYSKSINKQTLINQALSLQKDQINGPEVKDLMALAHRALRKDFSGLEKAIASQKKGMPTINKQDLINRITTLQKNGIQGPEINQLMKLAKKYMDGESSVLKPIAKAQESGPGITDRQAMLNKIVAIQKNGIQGPESKQLMDLAQKYMGNEITGLNELLTRQKKVDKIGSIRKSPAANISSQKTTTGSTLKQKSEVDKKPPSKISPQKATNLKVSRTGAADKRIASKIVEKPQQARPISKELQTKKSTSKTTSKPAIKSSANSASPKKASKASETKPNRSSLAKTVQGKPSTGNATTTTAKATTKPKVSQGSVKMASNHK